MFKGHVINPIVLNNNYNKMNKKNGSNVENLPRFLPSIRHKRKYISHKAILA